MKGQLKRLHSPDVADLESYSPGDAPFGFLLQAMIGPVESDGAEAFSMMVCTPEWFAKVMLKETTIRSGVHTIFVTTYDYRKLQTFIERAVHAAEEPTWGEIARRLSWLGDWEFSN